MKTFDERASNYWNSLSKPLASKQGLTETAYVVGALEQDEINKQQIKEMKEALQEYGDHKEGCSWHKTGFCGCRFEQALKDK